MTEPEHFTRLAHWAAQTSIAFAPDDDPALNAAVDRLVAGLDPAVRVLALGETLHGSEPLLRLRNRIFQRLAEAHGYTAVALESSFPRGRLLNEFVQGRGPDDYSAVQAAGFSHNFGALAGNRELAEWLRQANAARSANAQLHLDGFDSPTEMGPTDSPRPTLSFALGYAAAHDPACAAEFRQRIDPLLGDDAAWENPAVIMDASLAVGGTAAAQALRLAVEDLLTHFDVNQPAWAAPDPAAFAEARHYAHLTRQLLTYHAGLAQAGPGQVARLLAQRDVMMADNAAYLLAREQARGGKLCLFAHNSHLQRGPAQWQLGPELNTWWPAGAHLAARLGAGYAVIGTALAAAPAQGVGPAEPGTLEAALASGPGPARLVPVPRDPALATAPWPPRSRSASNSTYFPLPARALQDFDWLLVLSEA